jgi:hypothetical protein
MGVFEKFSSIFIVLSNLQKKLMANYLVIFYSVFHQKFKFLLWGQNLDVYALIHTMWCLPITHQSNIIKNSIYKTMMEQN